jgi:predicted transcriptional regulator
MFLGEYSPENMFAASKMTLDGPKCDSPLLHIPSPVEKRTDAHIQKLQPSYRELLSAYQRQKSRGMVEIMASILLCCLEGTKKTRIMCRANLTTRSINGYLEILVERGMLEKSDLYRTTVQGRLYLEYFNGMLALLGKSNVGGEKYHGSIRMLCQHR